MAEIKNNVELNEQENAAAEAAVKQTVPAASEAPAPQVPETVKPKLFAKGSKSRKIAGGVLLGLGGLLCGVIGYGVSSLIGEKKDKDVVDGEFVDVTPAADDTVPFDNNSF